MSLKIFVLCEGEGKYVGRILGQQLQRRLKYTAVIDRGNSNKLKNKLHHGGKYDYILNMGAIERVPHYSRVLNNFHTIRYTQHRKICLMKLRSKQIPIPTLITKEEDITNTNLPMFGKSSHSSDPINLWACIDMVDVSRSGHEGATHWVEFISDARKFKVHGVARKVKPNYSEHSDNFNIIKISERISKGNNTNRLYSDIVNKEDPIIHKLTDITQRTLSALNLHWGSVTVLADKEGKLKVTKVDACPSLKEDQANILYKYSYALCKMLGEDSQALSISRPWHE